MLRARWARERIHVANGRGGKIVNLERGQLSDSLRYMATAWGWSVNRVSRFLRRLETDTQITTQTDTAQTVITICNYDKYQKPPAADEHANGHANGEANGYKEKTKQQNKKDTAKNAGSSSDKKYAFEAGIIRLTEKDFEQWRTAFSCLDLPAELIALSPWAEKQGNWFKAVANALAKRNREAKIAIERSKGDADFKWNGIEGVI